MLYSTWFLTSSFLKLSSPLAFLNPFGLGSSLNSPVVSTLAPLWTFPFHHCVLCTRLSSHWILPWRGKQSRMLQGGFLGVLDSLENLGKDLWIRTIGRNMQNNLPSGTVLPLLGRLGLWKSNFIFAYFSKKIKRNYPFWLWYFNIVAEIADLSCLKNRSGS